MVEIYYKETGRVKNHPEGARSATKPEQTGGLPGCTLAPANMPSARATHKETGRVKDAMRGADGLQRETRGLLQSPSATALPREPFGGGRCARCAGPLGLAVNGICPACRQGVRRVPAEAMLREAEKAHARHEGMSPALDRLTEGRIRMLKARMKTSPPQRGGERESS